MSYERVGGTLMTNKENNFPKRRFKNFELSGPWEAKFLGELGKLNPKGQLPQTFEYVDLESVVGTEMVFHRKVTRDTAPSRAQRLAQSGDLFYQTVRPYQKNNFLATNLNGDYVFSTGYAQLRPLISGYFLLSLVQNDSFVKSVLSRCTGTSYPSISADELSKIQVLVSNDEQELYAIGKLFQKLDRLITLHQHKLDKLKNLKKAYLSEMFPTEGERVPKRRFPGFEGEWEQKRLATIASMHARIGWQNLRTSEFLNDGDYYLITGTDFLDGRINFDNCYYVDKERYQQDKNIQVKTGSILITKDGTIGKVAIVGHLDKPATLNAGVFNVVIKESNVDEKYLYQYLASPFLMDYVLKRVTGGTIKHLNQGILVDFPINIPTYEEQKAIGKFFEHLDQSITLQQQKLDKLNDLKKAYLNELFV